MIPREFAEWFTRASGGDADLGAVLLVDLLFHDPEGTGPAWQALEQTGALCVDSESARAAARIIFRSVEPKEVA